MAAKTLLVTLAAAGLAWSLYNKARTSRPTTDVGNADGAPGAGEAPPRSDESLNGAERWQSQHDPQIAAGADTGSQGGSAASSGRQGVEPPWPFPQGASAPMTEDAADEEPIQPGLPDFSRGA